MSTISSLFFSDLQVEKKKKIYIPNFLMVLQAIPVNAVTIVEEKSHIFVDKNQTTALRAAFVTVS